MLGDRRVATLPFAITGTACVVIGGLAAAVTAYTPSEHASWATAYLVLVAGVAQVALGAGQALLTPDTPSRWIIATEFGGWNGGNTAVIVGTLLGSQAVVDAGGVLLVGVLVLLAWGVRGAGQRRRWSLCAFRLLVFILLVSIPIGLLLAGRGPA